MENNEATTKLKILKGNSSLSIKNRLGDYLTIQFSDLSMTLLDKLQHQPLLASEENTYSPTISYLLSRICRRLHTATDGT